MLCEKPLAMSYEQAAEALTAVTAAGVRNAVGFNYRRLPAIALMQRMIAEGAVGEIRLWRATWLSDEFADPATPYDWRFDRDHGRDHDRRPRQPPDRHGPDHGRSGGQHVCAQAPPSSRSRLRGTRR